MLLLSADIFSSKIFWFAPVCGPVLVSFSLVSVVRRLSTAANVVKPYSSRSLFWVRVLAWIIIFGRSKSVTINIQATITGNLHIFSDSSHRVFCRITKRDKTTKRNSTFDMNFAMAAFIALSRSSGYHLPTVNSRIVKWTWSFENICFWESPNADV